ncbi:MAG: 3-coathanger stack domain-containing protein [Bacteroidota bacterium]
MNALRLLLVFIIGVTGYGLHAQAPDWTVDIGSFQNTMSVIGIVQDECVPSDDPADLLAAFDINGQIRGVQNTNVGNTTFLTVRSNGSGEDIFFKVYDASTDMVYNIHNVKVTYVPNTVVGSVTAPLELNFDSNPTGVNAGADQEIFNMSFAILDAEGMGTWSIIEGAGGSFTDASNPKTRFDGVIGTNYTLAWTLADVDGCIGETDEVRIFLVKNEPEDNLRTCADGLDNDGDGLTDCADPDCGKPVLSSATVVDPTPIDCNSTQADGSFTLVHTGADSFQLGMMDFQTTPMFTNLTAGEYNITLLNAASGCKSDELIVIPNTLDPLSQITEMNVMGPEILCMGLMDVHYTLDVDPPPNSLSWSYTGSAVTITPDGPKGSLLDFGANATNGGLVATLTTTCSTMSDTLDIRFAVPFLCGMFSNCPQTANITTGVLESANSPKVYRVGGDLITDAQVSNFHYEFTAGNTVEFSPGFSIDSGINFLADIKTCNK